MAAIARGDAAAIARDPDAQPIISIIEHSSDLGNFGRYRGVFELSLGIEAFTPQPGARPAVGEADKRTFSATAAIATYVPMTVATDRLSELLQSLAAAHPWEIPVIDIAEVHVFGRAPCT